MDKVTSLTITGTGTIAALMALLAGLCFSQLQPSLHLCVEMAMVLLKSVGATILVLSPLIMIGWSAALVLQQIKDR
jgi:hypothetical protein